jgi:hypothetical protein
LGVDGAAKPESRLAVSAAGSAEEIGELFRDLYLSIGECSCVQPPCSAVKLYGRGRQQWHGTRVFIGVTGEHFRLSRRREPPSNDGQTIKEPVSSTSGDRL